MVEENLFLAKIIVYSLIYVFLRKAFINNACVLIVAVTSSIKFENDFSTLLLYLKVRECRKVFIDDCKLSIKLS